MKRWTGSTYPKMLDDFTPILHTLPGQTIRVWAVADVHIGAKECDLDGFIRFLSKIAQNANDYLVLCGDLLNNGIKDSMTSVYEETMPPSAQVELAAELLAPVSDRILGCVGGNHELRTVKNCDIDIMHQVMTLIRKPELYRQNLCFIRVILENGGIKDHYSLLLLHGKTANKRKWFDLGAVEGVDAIIGGHLHSGNASKHTKLVFTTGNHVITKSVISLTASSWLNYGGYAARSLMLPSGGVSDPQCLVLEFTNTNSRKGRIHVSW